MNKIVKTSKIRLFITFSILFPLSTFTSVLAFKTASHVKVKLVSEYDSIQPGAIIWVGIHEKMEPEWHTYWKNPGESGAPTQIKWNLPKGFEPGPIVWPAPHKIEVPPVVSYGYEDEVLLMVPIKTPSHLKAGQKIRLAATVEWLECKDVCIPGTTEVQLQLPVIEKPPAINSIWADKFLKAREQLPTPIKDWKIRVEDRQDTYVIQIDPPANFNDILKTIYFYPEELRVINYSAPQILKRSSQTYSLKIEKAESSTGTASQLLGLLSLQSVQGQAIHLQISPVVENAQQSHSSWAWLVAIFFAFLGGLILNLMPCVLPVVSIKVLGFIKQSGGSRREALKQSLIFMLGVLVAFWVLAGFILVLRSSGNQLGWGFQLQSPVFIGALVSLFFLMGLNLFGLYEVGSSFVQLNDATKNHKGALKSFLSGILATIVAAPCTAPFMGSAMGYALSQPAPVTYLVFSFLGFGMALPYVLLSQSPTFLKYIPKPGPWMEIFKQIMGFMMMACVVWLLWVFGHQRDTDAVALALLGLTFQALGVWLWGRIQMGLIGNKRIGILLATIFFILGTVILFNSTRRETKSTSPNISENGWEEFSEIKIRDFQAQGRPVFIDFTAAWCLTCQVNEKVALNNAEVRKLFKEKNVALLKGDWTNKNNEITKVLTSYERSGVPFYLLYSSDPSVPPQILPEILTPDIVIKYLKTLS
jgi:thiol:disulfide interchange protein DsbD